jgi:peptidoglycan-N-acetylglucosamine deacetylase
MKRLAIAALCALSVGISAVWAGGDDPCMPKGGTMVDGKCLLTTEARVTVDYPLELGQNEVVASTIDPFIQSARDNFFQIIGDTFIPATGPYELDITYEEVKHSDTLVSLVFTVYEFTGGAHGNTITQTYLFDLQNGTTLTLDDLFTDTAAALEVINPLVEADISAKLGDMLDAQWLQDGTGTNPNNYQSFALDGANLIFYFPPYQVAPYAAGTQTVSIPLSQLSSVLAPALFAG